MGATIIDIADAVVTALNAASLSMAFTAERAYVPVHEAKDLLDLKVTVVPRELTLAAVARSRDEFDYVIDVAVQRRIENAVLAIDPYMELAEGILDLFRGKLFDYGAGGRAVCIATSCQNNPIYVPQHLDEHRVFTSVVSLTFRAQRVR